MLYEKATIDKKKMFKKFIIESISVTNGTSSRDRMIDNVTLYFEPHEIEALISNKKFATTYGTNHRIINKV